MYYGEMEFLMPDDIPLYVVEEAVENHNVVIRKIEPGMVFDDNTLWYLETEMDNLPIPFDEILKDLKEIVTDYKWKVFRVLYEEVDRGGVL